ncbi:MAG: nucleotidyltransferase family protein [Bacteroidota bacterium]
MSTPESFTARSPEAFARRHPQLLRQLREVLAKHPVKAAYLFGSYARGDERPDSDLDLYVQVDYEQGFGLSELYNLNRDLEAAIQPQIDIGTQLNDRLLMYAQDDFTLIYRQR